MLEIIKVHPDFMLFICIMLIVFIKAWYTNRKYNVQIEEAVSTLNWKLHSNGLGKYVADVLVVDPHTKQALNPALGVELIGDRIKKGYDFLVCESSGAPGEGVPWHKHGVTSEFFYVLSGELQIVLKDEIVKKKAGDWFYISARKDHSLMFTKSCKFIVVCKPPLFTRMDSFYEKFTQIFTRNV